MRKVIKSAGMTAQEMTYPDTPEERKAARIAATEAWRVAGNGFEIEVAEIEAWARGQLAAFGFKDLAAFRQKDPPLGDSLGDRTRDYAAQVLRLIGVVRAEIARGDAAGAARFALDVGMLFDRIQATLSWEKFALRGKAIADSKRGPARLYRLALDILGTQGANTPAKRIYKQLESRGEIIDGKPTFKAFSTQLSRHRKKSR